jgi:hypothetical protein
MKRAVSISIGSSKRNKQVLIELFGEQVLIERIGTDGDLEKARQLFEELDGVVDALGVGGGLLGLMVGERWYPMHSLLPLVKNVRKTPLVDGTGLKMTLERRAVFLADQTLKTRIRSRTALVMTAVDRWGMAQGALEAGYRCVFGDLLYSLSLPIPLHTERSIKMMAAMIAPIICRLPFHWVYPIGKSQEKRKPMFPKYFDEAGVIMGDCHYIWKHMPDHLEGRVIITNTTTPDDVAFFQRCGVSYLVTTTPVYEGRSFGTNMMEAAIIAASGRKGPIDYQHPGEYFCWIDQKLDELKLSPQFQELCP